MCGIAILSPLSHCQGDALGWHDDELAEGAGESSHGLDRSFVNLQVLFGPCVHFLMGHLH